jgi:hypothetical protein
MDAQDALLRAIKARVGGDELLAVREARSTSWASATFSGSRHRFGLTLSGEAASATVGRLADGIDAMEFELPGHLVADIAIVDRTDTPDGSSFAIEALTVEDW